ncbi:hypothetical protein OAH18_03605 [bacterium]|nr:hypothetical protein [bacterium]
MNRTITKKKLLCGKTGLILGNALIWAACMIGISMVLGAHKESFTITGLLTAGWFATNTMITSQK